MHDIFTRKEPTFERLTREFLSSLIYLVHPDTASTVGTVKFRLFNVEYEYSTDELAALLGIPHGDGAICETPLDSEWSTDAFSFWRQLSNSSINSFEGVLASLIHNPTIRIFRYMLACTIFGRENPNKVNARELLFLQGSLTNRRINSVPFMISHMIAVLRHTGTIAFGGLVTSIARALHLDAEIATLAPLPPRTINLKFLKDMKLCKVRRAGGFELMVRGVAIPSVVLPCTRRTDVRIARNWTYDLDAPPFTGPLPPNVPLGDGHETDEEYEQRDEPHAPPVSPHHASPAHTAPSTSNTFAGTAPGFYITEEMWRDQLAREERRDGLLSAIQQQLADNMSFMEASRQQSDRSFQSLMESQLAISREQHRQQAQFQRHSALMEATQGSLLGNLREIQSSQIALSARFDQFEASQSSRRRSRSRHPRHSPQDGEGPSQP